jgi:hypothetical protein
MRWKPDTRFLPESLTDALLMPLAALFLVAISPVIAVFYLDYLVRGTERWSRWFAWHPVTVGVWWDESRRVVWLELIERYRGSVMSDWLYRLRDSDGTATAAACEDMPVPQDFQARAESIAQNTVRNHNE